MKQKGKRLGSANGIGRFGRTQKLFHPTLSIYIYRENLNLFSDLKVIRVLKVRVLVQVSETKEQTLA